MGKARQGQDVRRARIETDLRPRDNVLLADPAGVAVQTTGGQEPGEVGAVDDALAGQVALPQKPAALGELLGAAAAAPSYSAPGVVIIELAEDILRYVEAKGVRQHVAPLLKLVVQLCHDGGEPRNVGGGARVPGVQEVVHAVQEPAHRDAGQEVERGVLGLVGVQVGNVTAREGHGRLNLGNAALWKCRQLG